MRTLLAVLAILCASNSPALAAVDPTAPLMGAANVSPPVATVVAPATVAIPAEALAALVARAEAAAAPAPKVSAAGVAGFSWDTIFGWLGGLLSLAFGAFAIFKTAVWLKARRIAEIAAEGAYHVAERLGVELGLEGAQRTALAIKAFYEAMTGHGITVISQSQVEAAKVTWKAMAAELPSKPVVPQVDPAALAQALAAAQAAKDVTTKTATEIAAEAARP